MPESFFVLSKENVELARDEVIAIAKTYDRFAKSQSFSNLVIIQSKTPWQKIAKRATFVKSSGQLLKKLSNLFLDDSYFSLLLEAKTFACRVINFNENKFDKIGLKIKILWELEFEVFDDLSSSRRLYFICNYSVIIL